MIAPKEESDFYENIKWGKGKSIAQVNMSLWETWKLFYKHRKNKFHFGLNYFMYSFSINQEEEKWKEKKTWKNIKQFSIIVYIIAFRLWPLCVYIYI